jgi:hypothetical protein
MKNAGVWSAGIRLRPCRYRSALIETPWAARPVVHEAGTWRGSVIAAAATMVARSNRRVHMLVSSGGLPNPQVTHRRASSMPVDSCPCVGIGLRVASDYLPDPEELVLPAEACLSFFISLSHWLVA